ncbi:MAG TPA: hypothetical protein PKW90_24400, partial [Myxococcota bacterium]|nr:hypothetical protein [Myxococcota bacterium]
MSAKATPGQFRKRAQEARKRMELSGSHFEGDTPAKRLRRMARAVVLPESFNGSYLPHYFRCEPAEFHVQFYRALETSKRTVARAPRGHAKSTVVT